MYARNRASNPPNGLLRNNSKIPLRRQATEDQTSTKAGATSKLGSKMTRTRSLSVVDENEDDIVFKVVFNTKENPNEKVLRKRLQSLPDAGTVNHAKRLRSRIQSVPDVSPEIRKDMAKKNKQEPKKKRVKIVSTPLSLNVPKAEELVPREQIISPVPLPPGVECIDPVENNGMFVYWRELTYYSKLIEGQFIFSPSEMEDPKNKRLPHQRKLLMEWIIGLSRHFSLSQETLYHTVRLVDSTLALRSIESAKIQLVGITSLLIAAKLEEYMPPAIDVLIDLTDSSYSREEVLDMEMKILKTVNFNVYGVEAMIFVNRYVRAAFRDSDKVFQWTCNLLMDSLVPCISFSSILPSKKAAAAVYASSLILPEETEGFSSGIGHLKMVWTPTLQYYSGYKESDLFKTSLLMLEKLLETIELSETGKRSELIKKYSSVSKYRNVFKRLTTCKDAIGKAINDLREALTDIM